MTKDNNIKLTDADVEAIALRVVSKMVKLKSMQDWFDHVNKSDASWINYEDLEIDEEAAAYGELAKLMTLMDIFKNDEAYEKCAIVKNRITAVKKIIKKYNK